jgi:hypothetical protein
MPATTEDIVAMRQEIWELLRRQMAILNSPEGLSDGKLMECYERQARVQELREKLQGDHDPATGSLAA